MKLRYFKVGSLRTASRHWWSISRWRRWIAVDPGWESSGRWSLSLSWQNETKQNKTKQKGGRVPTDRRSLECKLHSKIFRSIDCQMLSSMKCWWTLFPSRGTASPEGKTCFSNWYMRLLSRSPCRKHVYHSWARSIFT